MKSAKGIGKEFDNPLDESLMMMSQGAQERRGAAPSDFQLFMVTVKLFFGISYLSMPNTFSHCGLFGGMLLFTIVIGMNGITML